MKKLSERTSAQCVLAARTYTELTNAIEEAKPVRNSHLAEALEQLRIARQATKKGCDLLQASARCAESCLCPQQEKQETKNGNHTSLTKRAQVFLRWHEERLRQE